MRLRKAQLLQNIKAYAKQLSYQGNHRSRVRKKILQKKISQLPAGVRVWENELNCVRSNVQKIKRIIRP